MFTRGLLSSLRVVVSSACYVLLLTAADASLNAINAQTLHLVQGTPVPYNAKITVANAFYVSIQGWTNDQLMLDAVSSNGKIREQQIKIDSNREKVEIVCQSSQPDERISLTLFVPDQSTVLLKTAGNKIEVKEPSAAVSFKITPDSIDVQAPTSARLDMEDASQAIQYAQDAGQYRSVAHRTVGYGPPFIKFNDTSASIFINKPNRSTTQSAAIQAQPYTRRYNLRPLTIAAEAIASHNGMMSSSLRKSEPRLQSIYDDHQPDHNVKAKDSDDEEIKLQSHLVNLSLSVTDHDGRAIPNLKAENFSVYEDGVLQPITHFSPEQTPFNLVLLLDMSSSVRTKRRLIEEAALHFISLINPQDRVAIITFNYDVTVVSHLTQDRNELADAIRNAEFPGGGTSFYDALGYVLVEELSKVKGQRNAVVILTDGEDNALMEEWAASNGERKRHRIGSFLTFDQLLDGVQEADAMIYPVHLNPDSSPFSGQINAPGVLADMMEMNDYVTVTAKKQLQQLADATGGRVFNAQKLEDLNGVYEKVAAELRTVYSLAYAPSNQTFDGSFRKIAIRVNRPANSVARTRKGYYAW